MQNEDTTYKLLDYYEYTSKNKKAYIIVCVYASSEHMHELLKICCDKTDSLIDFLHDKIEDEDFDFNDNIAFRFNSYKKVYEPYVKM